MKIEINKAVFDALDFTMTRMANLDRFSDDDAIIAGYELQEGDAVIEKHGGILRYGVYLGTGIAYGAEIIYEKEYPCFFMNCPADDMPMRTIFETEGYEWRRAMMHGVAP